MYAAFDTLLVRVPPIFTACFIAVYAACMLRRENANRCHSFGSRPFEGVIALWMSPTQAGSLHFPDCLGCLASHLCSLMLQSLRGR